MQYEGPRDAPRRKGPELSVCDRRQCERRRSASGASSWRRTRGGPSRRYRKPEERAGEQGQIRETEAYGGAHAYARAQAYGGDPEVRHGHRPPLLKRLPCGASPPQSGASETSTPCQDKASGGGGGGGNAASDRRPCLPPARRVDCPTSVARPSGSSPPYVHRPNQTGQAVSKTSHQGSSGDTHDHHHPGRRRSRR